MANPLLIGGLVIGGTMAAWRLTRNHRRRLRAMLESLAHAEAEAEPERPIPLKRDPATGIYRPVDDTRTGRE